MVLKSYKLPHQIFDLFKFFQLIIFYIRNPDLSVAYNYIAFVMFLLSWVYFTANIFSDQWILQPVINIPKPQAPAASSSQLIAIKASYFIQFVSSMDCCF